MIVISLVEHNSGCTFLCEQPYHNTNDNLLALKAPSKGPPIPGLFLLLLESFKNVVSHATSVQYAKAVLLSLCRFDKNGMQLLQLCDSLKIPESCHVSNF